MSFSAGHCHSSDECNVADSMPLQLTATVVIEATIRDQKFKERQGLLSAVRVDFGGVQIVDE